MSVLRGFYESEDEETCTEAHRAMWDSVSMWSGMFLSHSERMNGDGALAIQNATNSN